MPNTYQLMTNLHDPGGNYVANVFHYSLSESGAGDAFDYANALITGWIAHVEVPFLTSLGNDMVLDFITAKRVSGTGGPTAQQVSGATGLGTGPSDAAGLAADVQWQTASSLNRPGHTFLAAVPVSAYQSGSWQAPYPTTVAAWITAVRTSLTLTGGLGTADFGIFTRKGKIFNVAKAGQLLPKPTMLNKRTKPVI